MQTVTWSDVPNDVWQKYTLGALEVRKIPEGYVITEMYNTLRNENHQPVRGGVLINDKNYWPVKYIKAPVYRSYQMGEFTQR